MKILDLFSKASGLKVNLNKSKAQCSKNVSARRRAVLSGASSIRFCQNLGRYLGVNIGHDRLLGGRPKKLLKKFKGSFTARRGVY